MSQISEIYGCFERLRSEMDAWLIQSIKMDGPGPNGGGEDEANYSLAWFPHYLITGNPGIKEHFDCLFDCLSGWVKRECLHGYEPEAEAHHGTEPFLLFLPRYIGLFPEKSEAKALLEDAAHHIGNWINGIPEWYDYDKDCFHSYYLGTKVVKHERRFAYEVAEHFRFIHIALSAYNYLGDEKYLDWALRYGRKRAERIIDAGDPMPLLWDQNGEGLGESEVTERNLHGLAGSGHHVPGDPLAGIENLLASGAIYAFGDLYSLSSDEIYRDAAKRIIEPLIPSIADPYGDPGASAIAYYRYAFSDDSLDDRIKSIIKKFPDESSKEIAMIFPQERKRREFGVGKRNDMIYWGEWSEDGSVKPISEPSASALALAYQLTGDPDYVLQAFQSAGTKLNITRRVLRGGREHSDMGGAICSIAAGHGRNWGQGAITGCYGVITLGTREVMGKVKPMFEIRNQDGRLKIPEGILPLIRPSIHGNGEAMLYNASDLDISFSYSLDSSSYENLTLKADEVVRLEI